MSRALTPADADRQALGRRRACRRRVGEPADEPSGADGAVESPQNRQVVRFAALSQGGEIAEAIGREFSPSTAAPRSASNRERRP